MMQSGRALGTFEQFDLADPNIKCSYKRGDEMGGFKLGSTLVLIFEAPSSGLDFCIEHGQKLKMGHPLFQ
jgi:phosphatidylserine decarboxylase